MKYCALLDPNWELRLEHSWGPFFFSLLFISLEAKWGNGRSYFILVDQAVCFGLLFTFALVGLFCSHLIIQCPNQDQIR